MSRSGAATIEKAKSDLLDFYIAVRYLIVFSTRILMEQSYLQEVEQRKWYGFWDYGDVMHTYGERTARTSTVLIGWLTTRGL